MLLQCLAFLLETGERRGRGWGDTEGSVCIAVRDMEGLLLVLCLFICKLSVYCPFYLSSLLHELHIERNGCRFAGVRQGDNGIYRGSRSVHRLLESARDGI